MSIPKSASSSLYRGKGEIIAHLLFYQNLLTYYRGSDNHKVMLHEELVAYVFEYKFLKPDHVLVIAEFELSN